MNRDCLFEIGTEELPPGAQRSVHLLGKDIAENIFKSYGLDYKDLDIFVTPCRIILYAKAIELDKKAGAKEIMGPPKRIAYEISGKPSKALEGFSKKTGVAISKLIEKDTDKGVYIVAKIKEKAADIKELMPDICKEFIENIPFTRTMVWNESRVRFSRPIRWFLCMFSNDFFDFEYAGLKAGDISYKINGYKGQKFKVRDIKKYFEMLGEGQVIPSFDNRLSLISSKLKEVKSDYGKVVLDTELLEEVTSLVEYPDIIVGRFDKSFLKLPDEVIITVLKHHQKYFTLKDKKGNLVSYFAGIHNGVSSHTELVQQGYEKVLAARLADAMFFYDLDKKISLGDRINGLKNFVYQDKLGSVYEKLGRLDILSEKILDLVLKDNRDVNVLENIKRIIRLSKTDLLTELVQEFPELEGIMGSIYAEATENEIVAGSIKDHYLPRHTGDELPASLEASVVSIADKMDNIAGAILLGNKLTGSSDPFGIRRQIYGIMEICVNQKWDFDIFELVSVLINSFKDKFDKDSLVNLERDLKEILCDRLEKWLLEKKFRVDVARAIVLNKRGAQCMIYSSYLKAKTITNCRDSQEFMLLIALYKRANNILKQVGLDFSRLQFRTELLSMKEEKILYQKLEEIVVEDSCKTEKEYTEIMDKFASLKPCLDKFFDAVLVMDKDEKVRNNRLILLNNLVSKFRKIAEFSYIENKEERK